MTVILASVAYWAPVEFARQGDDLQPEKITFRARYKRLKKSDRIALEHRLAASVMLPETRRLLQERIEDSSTGEADREFLKARLAASPTTDGEILDELLVDWDLRDHKGEFVPYTKATRLQLEEDLDGFEDCLVRVGLDVLKKRHAPAELEKNSAAQSGISS